MRYTSRQAYDYICESGILGDRRTQVYSVLYNNGPLSSRDVWEAIRPHYPRVPQHSINPRMIELSELKVVRDVGVKICSYTGRRVMLWDVTDHTPTGPYRRQKSVSLDVLKEREECAKIADRVGGLTIAKLIRRRTLKDTV